MSTPTSIRLAPPEVEGRTVRFRWSVTPEPSLYRATSFTLTYPESVDVAAVPEAVWWRVALCCLHSQWVLLRPCRVVLPVRLPPGEAEAWLRLCDAQQATLEGNAGGDDDRRAIELIEAGPELTEGVRPRPDGPAVACFSGGRDSLVQAALLVELGSPPALVTVSAAREGSVEHDHPRRTRALRAIQERRSLELIEVTSDLRMCFRNDAAVERYDVGVTELVDTFLYFGAALGVAAARGAPTVFLASEAEVQDNARNGGMIIQHRHAMYSGVTQRALSAILAPAGFSYDGLTASLRQFHVQRLLSERYVDLRDLQFSCWSQTREQAACSACSECRGIALNLLADGVDPATAGIDLATLLPAQEAWRPRVDEFGSVRNVGRRASDLHTVRRLAGLEPARIEAALAVQGAPAPAQKEALTAYTRLRAAALELVPEPGPEPGYRTGFLALQPASRRAVLERIIAEHVAPEPEEEHEEVLARANALVDWITAPLGRRSRVPAAPGVPSAERPVRPRPPDPAPPTEAELAGYRHLIPGREPVLAAPAGRRVLRVAETLLDGNERAYVDECIDGNWISSAGSFVGRFEQAFAQASGCAYGVACSSGTTALHLALAAAGIGPGDEVIVPTFTMIATANAVDYLGARAVLVDTDPATWNLDLDQVAARVSPRTRAIVVVHTYGQPVDMQAVRRLAEDNGLAVIEDAAEAHGARADGQPVGSLGDVASFSFYGNKILTTGEGGMVTTNDPEIAAVARELRDHAFSPERHFWHRFRAYNFRMSNLQAAVGLAQVERLEQLVARRRANAELYAAGLADVAGIELPPSRAGHESVHWMFGLTLGPAFGLSRDELRAALATEGIETRTFFVPLHLQPAYRQEHRGRRHPVAERLGATGLYLPSSPQLTPEDITRITDAVRAAHQAAAAVLVHAEPAQARPTIAPAAATTI